MEAIPSARVEVCRASIRPHRNPFPPLSTAAGGATQNKPASQDLVNANGVLESITDAFFGLDNEWRFAYLNSQAERTFGRTRDDLLGKNIWDEFPRPWDRLSNASIIAPAAMK